jgi:hypothetical protein
MKRLNPTCSGMPSDFSFISPRSFLRTVPKENGPGMGNSYSIELYRFAEEDAPNVNLIPCTVLLLPPDRMGSGVRRLTVTTGAWVARALLPFDIDNSMRIYVFNIHMFDMLSLGIPMTFVVRGRDLQKMIDAVPRGGAVRLVKWKDWIPSMTRFLGYIFNFGWRRCVLQGPAR